jgi:hypothetical protein
MEEARDGCQLTESRWEGRGKHLYRFCKGVTLWTKVSKMCLEGTDVKRWQWTVGNVKSLKKEKGLCSLV